MIEEDPNDPMPDRMTGRVALLGYGLGALIIWIMFEWALPATAIN